MENNNQIAVIEKSALIPMEFNESQVALIKTTVAKGTTNDQLALFLYTCKKTGLDPLAKQIHCVVRQTKNGPVMSIQTAIDGYRLIADRSGKYAGNDDPIYDNEQSPKKATVTVYKLVSGIRCAFTATARWEQYFPGDLQGFMWKKMPHLMLGKCAEALALRKAFPAELSGVYTHEEMQQADVTVEKPIIKPSIPLPNESSFLTTDELKAKAEEAKARLHQGEATKSEPEASQTHKSSDSGLASETVKKRLKGLIAAYYAPTGKGPHKFYIEGEYCQTFDNELAEVLKDHNAKEESVEVSCHIDKSTNKSTGKVYENNVIDEVSVQA